MGLFAMQRTTRPIRRAGYYRAKRDGLATLPEFFPTRKAARRFAVATFGTKAKLVACA